MNILGIQKTSVIDYPNNICTTVFTGGCNFRCPFCHNGDLVLSPNDKVSSSPEVVLERLNKKKRILDGVCITGGEPTLQPDLIDFIKDIRKIGLKVKLDTNGSNPEILETLITQNLVNYIAMDIKHTKSKYNSIVCAKNFDVEQIECSIDILANTFVDYEFRTTVVDELHDIEDFEEIGKWTKDAPIFFLQAYRYSDRVINPIFSTPSDKKLNACKEILKKYIPRVYIRQ